MTPGVRRQDEQDYPSPIQDSVSILPFHVGGEVELATAAPVEVVHVEDLRRFENSEHIVSGEVSSINGNRLVTDVTDLDRYGIIVDDQVENTTQLFTTTIVNFTASTLTVPDGTVWAANDEFVVNKRASHQFSRAVELRKISLISDGTCYIRFDGEASDTYYDVHLEANEGYFSDYIRIVTRISAIRIGSGTVTIRYTCWGL